MTSTTLSFHLVRSITAFVLCFLLFSTIERSYSLTILFSDNFSNQTSVPTNWIYGNNSTAQTPGPGDSLSVVSSGGSSVLQMTDVLPFQNPMAICHTVTPFDISSTGDKVIQLNVDLEPLANDASYRIGLYNTTASSGVVARSAFHFRIFPGQTTNNVSLITFDQNGVLQDNILATTNPADIQGLHSLALQIDFTRSATRPLVRGFSNGKLVIEIQASTSGGFRLDSTDGKTVRILVQGNSFSMGASCKLDNISLTSFSPGAILLGSVSGNNVNRRIWGHNLESADSSYLFSNAPAPNPDDSLRTGSGVWDPDSKTPVPAIMARLSGGIGCKVLRYPGGCCAHGYNWKASIGPIASRGRSDWHFGLDEYLRLCEQAGMEPVITCSDYALPQDEMPLHLAQLVEYVNAPAIPAHPWAMQRKSNGREAPYGVKYFELGNESSHGNHYILPHRQYTAQEYGQYAVKCTWAMRAVDPSVQLGIVALPGGGQDATAQWNTTVLSAAGKAADFVVLHLYAPRYAQGDSAPSESNLMQACMAVGEQFDRRLADYREVIQQCTGRNMAMAVTEYNASFANTDSGVKPYRYSFGAALMSADLMRVFLKPGNNVLMANYWQVLNGFWGMIGVTSRPAVEPMTERPAYPLFKLWGNHFGDTVVNVSVSSPVAEFDGERRVEQAKGDTFQDREFLSSVSLITLNNLSAFNGIPNLAAFKESDTLRVVFSDYNGQYLPQIGQASPPASAAGRRVDYELEYEGQYEPVQGGVVPFNALLQDSRGWTATQSSVSVGPVLSANWEYFKETLPTLKDATAAVSLLDLRIPTPIAGTLRMKNPKMNVYTKRIYPAYSLLTTAGSVSADGRTRYLIVFNKSDLHIPAPITLNGFGASSAKVWEVNGPNLVATTGVGEVKSGQSLALNGSQPINYVFPAHSMTAIEFYQ